MWTSEGALRIILWAGAQQWGSSCTEPAQGAELPAAGGGGNAPRGAQRAVAGPVLAPGQHRQGRLARHHQEARPEGVYVQPVHSLGILLAPCNVQGCIPQHPAALGSVEEGVAPAPCEITIILEICLSCVQAATYHKTSIDALLHPRHNGATPYRIVLGDVSPPWVSPAPCAMI